MLQKFNRINLSKSHFKSYNIRLFTAPSNGSTCSPKIVQHFSKNGQVSNLNLFPSELKRVTSKKGTEIYIADKNAAEVIAKAICRFHVTNVPFFEINPGPCILTKALLRHLNPIKLGLIEKNGEFGHIQQKLAQLHRTKILLNPIKHRWSHYTSIANSILEHSEKQQWHDDVTCQLFMYLQSQDFYRIINDVIRLRRLFTNGRVDIFAILPSIEYMKMTAKPDSTYLLYTQKSCLFQILFEYELLAEFKKESFLPWYSPKPAYGGKFEEDTDLFYLVRMVPRRDLFSICHPNDLPLLRFFVYQCLFKRKAYIIPKLERWIPGIGVDLITSKFEQSSYNEPNSTNLMQNLRNKFHVFTECGSLTPLQICGLFQFFQKSPKYTTSCFHQQCKHFIEKSKTSHILDK